MSVGHMSLAHMTVDHMHPEKTVDHVETARIRPDHLQSLALVWEESVFPRHSLVGAVVLDRIDAVDSEIG